MENQPQEAPDPNPPTQFVDAPTAAQTAEYERQKFEAHAQFDNDEQPAQTGQAPDPQPEGQVDQRPAQTVQTNDQAEEQPVDERPAVDQVLPGDPAPQESNPEDAQPAHEALTHDEEQNQ